MVLNLRLDWVWEDVNIFYFCLFIFFRYTVLWRFTPCDLFTSRTRLLPSVCTLLRLFKGVAQNAVVKITTPPTTQNTEYSSVKFHNWIPESIYQGQEAAFAFLVKRTRSQRPWMNVSPVQIYIFSDCKNCDHWQIWTFKKYLHLLDTSLMHFPSTLERWTRDCC